MEEKGAEWRGRALTWPRVRIMELLRKKGFTNRDISSRMDIAESYVSRVLNGRRPKYLGERGEGVRD